VLCYFSLLRNCDNEQVDDELIGYERIGYMSKVWGTYRCDATHFVDVDSVT